MRIPYHIALVFIIAIEGYVVLSSELLAIRQTIPFIGSGTDTVSIIIAAVLMPLAFGYQAGGKFKSGYQTNLFGKKRYMSIRDKLIHNIVVSSWILLVGLSYIFIMIFFEILHGIGLNHRLIMISMYSGLFLVYPVYLLGQTIPLCSNYFSKEKLSQATGRILFFSTMGSFLGAIFSTLVLMSTIGVHHTVTVNFALLFILVLALSKSFKSPAVTFSFAALLFSALLNSDHNMSALKIVENNKYNTIAVAETEEGFRQLIMNNNLSSQYHDDGRKNEYIEFVEKIALKTLPEHSSPKRILVVGAGAFTFGKEDTHNIYDFIDIDGSLLEIAEEHILKEPLTENKTFHAVPARGFLNQTGHLYDIVLLDAYFGDLTIPEHLVTKDFFEHIKSKTAKGGVIFANFIADASFNTKFSQKIDNTFREVFNPVSRVAIHDDYNLWGTSEFTRANIIYIYKNVDPVDGIYTDNKNTMFLDKPQKR